MDNKRRFSRITFNVKCTLTLGNEHLEVSLVDIALKGALIEVAQPVTAQLKTPCSLSIELDGLEAPLHFSADVMHVHENRIGVKFTATDIDSMIHLRSIVESNTADPEKVSRELSFLIDAN
jgi:hypothetical protein